MLLGSNVSRETIDAIDRYLQQLLAWNKMINLTSRQSTKESLWRHILDSFYVRSLLKNRNSSILEVGSGNGLVGITLGLLGFHNVNLVEKNAKKAAFLQYIVSEFALNVRIIHDDVRKISRSVKYDYIISKAVTDMLTLVSWVGDIIENSGEILVINNCQMQAEAEFSRQFEYEICSDNSGRRVLKLKHRNCR